MKGILKFATFFSLLIAQASHSYAETPEVKRLPSTLTLEYALSLADEPHPNLLLDKADLATAEARQKMIESEDDLNARIQAQLQYIDPSPIAYDQGNDDHRLGLIINKDLYDFGLQASRSQSAQLQTTGYRYAYQDSRAKRRLEIARRYFDVLLADLVFYRYNEEMAVEYILLDRLKARKELGKASDLEVIEQEQHYQEVRYLRADSQNKQRRTRAALAEVLNRPGQLPSELAVPELGMLKKELPEYEDLLKMAFENNNKLKMLRARLASAQSDIESARAGDNPKLKGNFEAYSYTHEWGSADRLRAGVTLEIPLYDGDRTDSAVANARAKLYKIQAELLQAESEIRQAVLDTWLELDSLKIKREHVNAIQNYREMDLDHRRALYEMEVKTDLGKGMALISEAQFFVKQTEYKMASAWIRLDILTGQLKLPEDRTDAN